MEKFAVTIYKKFFGKVLFQFTNLETGAVLIIGTYEKAKRFLENFITDEEIQEDMLWELELGKLLSEIQEMEVY